MYQKELLSNGIRIVTEEIDYVNSVSIGIWVKVGSRYENSKNNGVSHFIEHMLFKGTKKRSAKEIANAIDKIGGQLNAFTAKECTCYYAKVLDSHFDIALDVLSDMFFDSVFAVEEIEKEKGVVLEEINMYEDSPEDLVHDIFSQIVWSGNSLGRTVLGTKESVMSLDRDSIVQFLNSNYIPEKIVISVVGKFNKNEIIDKIKDAFGSYSQNIKEEQAIEAPQFMPNFKIKTKDTEQVHLCLGFNGIELSNRYYHSLLVLNNIFGGSMSSRLFQTIREDNGIAYSVFSYPSSYHDCGLFSIYAGMKGSQLERVCNLINNEIVSLKQNGFSNEEVFDSKEQLKGSYTLGLESTSSRMISIGKSELLLNKIYLPEEVLRKIDEVKMEDIDFLINEIFNIDKMAGALIGNISEDINLKGMLVK